MAEARFGIVERLVASRGGGLAELWIRRARVRRYDARDGGVDSIAFSETLTLGLRIFRDGRSGFSYGFRDDPEAIREMVENALFCAAASDPDPACDLPDAPEGESPGDDPAGGPALYDPSCESLEDAAKTDFVRSLEASALAADPRIRRVRGAVLKETVARESLVNSRGRRAARRESSYAASVEAVAEEGSEGQTGYGFGFARGFGGLRPEEVALEGAGRALRMLGAKLLPTGRYAVVLENGAAADLLKVLAPSFLASQVVKGRSFLAGKRGEPVASGRVGIVDDPFDAGGCGAAGHDAEGTPSRRNVLVAEGRLRGFLADAVWGRKLGGGTTAGCRRAGPKVPPAPGISNLAILPGERSREELVRDAWSGILLSEFLGIHTADPVSGDFSVGAAGFRIEGGREAGPVRGFAVSGNLVSLLSDVTAAGSDFRWFGPFGAPSLGVAGLEVGGTGG